MCLCAHACTQCWDSRPELSAWQAWLPDLSHYNFPVNLSIEVLTDMEFSLWLIGIEAVFVKAP